MADKITGVQLDTCNHSTADRVTMSGFGAAILAGPNPANRHNAVSVTQGTDVTVSETVTVDVGNAILFGRFRPDTGTSVIPTDCAVVRPHITGSADNAIYVSSADRIEVEAPTVIGCNSSGVRIQGNNVTVRGGYLFDCGAGIAVQGLETTATIDGRWAGHGSIIDGVTIEQARTIGVTYDDRSNSGFYTRDNSLSGVTIIGGCTTGGSSVCWTCPLSPVSGRSTRPEPVSAFSAPDRPR